MKLALNGATIMRSSLADDVEIAAACGYDALEIWAGKLDAYIAAQPLRALAGRMRELGLQPWCINSIEDITQRDGEGRKDVLAQVEHLAGVARELGAPSIVVVPGSATAHVTREERITDAVDVLTAMADAAGDVSLAFEFLGKSGCAVPVLDMAIEIVNAVNRHNVGLVIDMFHFYAGRSSFDDLARVPLDKLFVVHLNGCEDAPREQLTDAHRLYPGEGVIPSVEVLEALRAGGWDGVVSIEIFRPEYWGQDAAVVAQTARQKAAAVLRKAGYELDG